MKRLKYKCLFNGRSWPLIASVFAAIAGWGFSVMHGWPGEITRLLLLAAPLAVLAVSYLIIQIPTRKERALIANSNYPLWVPADPRVIRCVRDEKEHFSNDMIRALYCIGAVAVACLVPVKSSVPNFGAAIVFAFLGGCVLAADIWLRSRWKSIDQSAVMTIIPIDHMYDIVQTRDKALRGTEYRKSLRKYAVFYLPDGRYVLPLGQNAGYVKGLYIVQYNGMLTYIPAYESKPEDYTQ
ncbi:MAG: hypothetical protein IKX57_06050 [Oscillospiraceae bacterium]|nr:hypothetical protein [Oscillospiraceae bacterium]MBR5723175.1 hypothetical protein [Oscillospiraceae bacterium]